MVWLWDWFVGFFRRKRLLRVYMFNNSGDIDIFRRKVKESKFDYKNGSYVVIKNRTYYDKHTQKANAFYREGNPEPINLEHNLHPDLSAEALKKVIKNDMVRDAYAKDGENTELILLILLCVIGVIAILNLLISFKVIKVS